MVEPLAPPPGALTDIVFREAAGSPPLLLPAVPAGGAHAGDAVSVARVVAGSLSGYGEGVGGGGEEGEAGDGEEWEWEEEGGGDAWGADMLHGCHCDGYGEPGKEAAAGDRGAWEGPACARRSCPFGAADPAAAAVRRRAPAEVIVTCEAGGGRLAITVGGGGGAAVGVVAAATAEVLRRALEEALPALGRVEIVAGGDGGGGGGGGGGDEPVCGDGYVATTRLRLWGVLGAPPTIVVDDRALDGEAAVTAAPHGDSDDEECSGRGTCGERRRSASPTHKHAHAHSHSHRPPPAPPFSSDTVAGLCACFPGSASSDGAGRPGTRGDCGADAAAFVQGRA